MHHKRCGRCGNKAVPGEAEENYYAVQQLYLWYRARRPGRENGTGQLYACAPSITGHEGHRAATPVTPQFSRMPGWWGWLPGSLLPPSPRSPPEAVHLATEDNLLQHIRIVLCPSTKGTQWHLLLAAPN